MMKKSVYFDKYRGMGWPRPSELEHYFLAPRGQRWTFGNDCWGLAAEGVDGTEHLPIDSGCINLNFTMLGNPDHGVLLHYHKWGRGVADSYYAKGNLGRLHEWLETKDGDLMPIGLFVPFEVAWKAVKEFIERDGALPTSIAWVAGRDLPASAFPDPPRPDPRRG